MRRLSTTILPLLLLLSAVASAAPVASLVTVGPGDEVWEKFGHNMIRIQDPERGLDVCWNWGVFDFNKPNFIWNFIQGRSLYTMVPSKTQDELDEYHAQNRHVTFQKLNLTETQVIDLWQRCYANYKTNPDYRYDYFKDNCSTRVRDMLDGETGGALAKAMQGQPTQPTVTYRHETLRLTQGDFWVSLGLDFAMGPYCDKPLDLWADGFLPSQVSQSATVITDAPVEAWPSTRPPSAAQPPTRWPWLGLCGLAGAGFIIVATRQQRWMGVTLATFWWIFSGLGGAFMTFMWFFTDHAGAYANQNLWHFSPLAWLVLAAMLFRFRRTAKAAAGAVVGLAVLGCIIWAIGRLVGGPWAQPNGGFILLSLPLNLAAAWVTLAVPAASAADALTD